MDCRLIGLDIGSYKATISSIDRFNTTIILNEASNRQTPVSITFSDQERSFGEASAMVNKFKYSSTVQGIMRFLVGTQQQRAIETSYNHCKLIGDRFHLANQEISIESVAVSFVSYLIRLAKVEPNQIPIFCFAVPNSSDYNTCKSLSQIISVSTPFPNSIINESVAISLDYLSLNAFKQQTILFIDFGHSKISSYLIAFGESSITEVIQLTDLNLGVRNIDRELFAYLATKIQLNEKRIVRLWEITRKTRVILSANTECSIHEELGDQDLQVNISRTLLEQICEQAFGRLQNYLTSLDTEIRKHTVRPDFIQIFGGGSRIPKFQQLVSDILGWPVKRTVNSSDSIARGCSLFLLKAKGQSRLSKYELKERVKSQIYLYINFLKDDWVGAEFDKNKCSRLEQHIIYTEKDWSAEKLIQIEIEKHNSVELWLMNKGNTQHLGYYRIEKKPSDSQFNTILIRISASNNFPRVVSSVLKNRQNHKTRQIELKKQNEREIDHLRAVELGMMKKDVISHKNHEKLNLICSQVFKLKDRFPQLSQYDDHSTILPADYDKIIARINSLKKQK